MVTDECVTDDSVTDKCVLWTNAVMNESVMDESVPDECVTDESVKDERVMDECDADERVVDECVMDECGKNIKQSLDYTSAEGKTTPSDHKRQNIFRTLTYSWYFLVCRLEQDVGDRGWYAVVLFTYHRLCNDSHRLRNITPQRTRGQHADGRMYTASLLFTLTFWRYGILSGK